MDSLQVTDAQSQAVAVAPRVSLSDIEAAISERIDINAAQTLADAGKLTYVGGDHPLELLSICILVMKNGFTIIGKSAPASRDNFNPDLGKKFAYEDAIRQIWPLMGFALRDRLAETAKLRG